MSLTCIYCKKVLSSTSALNLHLKRTKYCLKLQAELKLKESNSNLLETQVLASDYKALYEKLLIDHTRLLEDKKTIEAKYDALIEKITSKTHKTTINTNNIISVFNRTDEEIKNIYSENLTIDHIAGGVQAIAKLIVEKVIKDMTGKPMITITDKSRGNAKYKLSTGEVVIDNGLDKFTEKHRELVIKRMYQVASNPEHFADFLDTESTTCTGYNEIVDDSDGANLKKNIIKNI